MADLSPSATYGGILGMDSGLVDSGGLNPALSMISGDWLGAGLQIVGGLFGSKTDISQSGAGGQSLLNTSGWATGDSSAEGSELSSSQNMSAQGVNDWPWWVWAAGTLVAVAVIKKAV